MSMVGVVLVRLQEKSPANMGNLLHEYPGLQRSGAHRFVGRRFGGRQRVWEFFADMDVGVAMIFRRTAIVAIVAIAWVSPGYCQQKSDGPVCRETLVVGSVRLSLQGHGALSVAGGAEGENVIQVDLPYLEKCDFVRWVGANVIHIEKYYDAWIALIQCHRKLEGKEANPRFGCDTRYKAVIVRDDGRVFLSQESNGGSGCPPIVRERHEFTYLADKYVHKDKRSK